jgi:hypothetical protein
MKNTPICILCTGFATVTPLLLSKNIGYDTLDDESLTDVFTRVHQHLREKGSFRSVNRCAERQVQQNVEEDENIIDMVQRSACISTRRISAHFCVLRMRVWRTLHAEGMYPYHIQRIQHLEPADMCSRLELCHWTNSNSHMNRNILFTDEAHFTR